MALEICYEGPDAVGYRQGLSLTEFDIHLLNGDRFHRIIPEFSTSSTISINRLKAYPGHHEHQRKSIEQAVDSGSLKLLPPFKRSNGHHHTPRSHLNLT
jgi:hypothetical protein